MIRPALAKTISNSLSAFHAGRVLLAAVALTASISAPSFAQTLANFTLTGIEGAETVGVSLDSGTNFYNRAVGRYQATIDNTAYNVFCVDIIHGLGLNESYTASVGNNITDAAGPLVGNYYNGGLASALTPQDYETAPSTLSAAQRSSQIAFLADNFLNANTATFGSGISGSTSVSDNLAAISLSIWDLGIDGGDGISTGRLQIDNDSKVRLSGLVSYYQNLALSNSNYVSSTAKWVQAPRTNGYNHRQDVVYTPKPVPEASTLALLGLLIPAIPFVRRTRRVA